MHLSHYTNNSVMLCTFPYPSHNTKNFHVKARPRTCPGAHQAPQPSGIMPIHRCWHTISNYYLPLQLSILTCTLLIENKNGGLQAFSRDPNATHSVWQFEYSTTSNCNSCTQRKIKINLFLLWIDRVEWNYFFSTTDNISTVFVMKCRPKYTIPASHTH